MDTAGVQKPLQNRLPVCYMHLDERKSTMDRDLKKNPSFFSFNFKIGPQRQAGPRRGTEAPTQSLTNML